jgi:hypothetical protein
MTEMQTECESLAVHFEKMAANGLVDVKFFLRNLDEATAQSVCHEVRKMYEAVDAGACAPLVFNDSHGRIAAA